MRARTENANMSVAIYIGTRIIRHIILYIAYVFTCVCFSFDVEFKRTVVRSKCVSQTMIIINNAFKVSLSLGRESPSRSVRIFGLGSTLSQCMRNRRVLTNLSVNCSFELIRKSNNCKGENDQMHFFIAYSCKMLGYTSIDIKKNNENDYCRLTV